MWKIYEVNMLVEVKPIRSEADYEETLAEIEKLFDAKPETLEGDRLEILTALVEDFEEQHYPVPLPDPVDAILYFLESRGLTRKDLELYLGSRARVSEILNRKRPLSLEMIRRLSRDLGIPAEILIQPYEVRCTRIKPTGRRE
jgi:HTH-type transcriptional regulator/antitoxin HigA